MRVGVVVIGRNEGARLVRGLTSLADGAWPVVYVDSGSTDDSVARARALGVKVVELDMDVPFTAARARNAGAAALRPDCDAIQFVDGDCSVADGWIEIARAALEGDAEIGMVTGWRREIAPERSIYNAMADAEWHRPAGRIDVCGGDFMVRRAVFDVVGGFDPTLIVSEDEEFCLRVGDAGHTILRLPETMTLHDADMTRFGQWWVRAVRTGHGFAEVGRRHPRHFRRERARMWVYGGVLPVLLILSAAAGLWAAQMAVVAAYAVNWWRTAGGLEREGMARGMARRQAGFLTLSKLPNMVGAVTYHIRRLRGIAPQLIEYK